MAFGLAALLDDIAVLAKVAAASVDDVAAAAGRAGAKTAGVVIDDAAVTPSYVVGLSPARELPIIWKITLGSLRNKLLVLLPAALILAKFAPFLITPILMIGGAYLAFEASEKILETLLGGHKKEESALITLSPEALEKRQVAGAIRTDFILSAEIMAITLAALDIEGLWQQTAALALVAVVVTVAIYGLVAVIVKLDDIGFYLIKKESLAARKIGSGLVAFVPWLLKGLSIVGTAAMLWVGGGIILHGLETLSLGPPFALWIHHQADALSSGNAALAWVLNALGASLSGLVIGLSITQLIRPLIWVRQKVRGVPEA